MFIAKHDIIPYIFRSTLSKLLDFHHNYSNSAVYLGGTQRLLAMSISYVTASFHNSQVFMLVTPIIGTISIISYICYKRGDFSQCDHMYKPYTDVILIFLI